MKIVPVSSLNDLSVGDFVQFSFQGAMAVGNIISFNQEKDVVNIKIFNFLKTGYLTTTEEFFEQANFVEVLLKDIVTKIIYQEAFIAEIGNTRGSFNIGYAILIEDHKLALEEQKKQAYDKLYEYLKGFSNLSPEREMFGVTVNWNENFYKANVTLKKVILL
jgi:hypothetical protein